MGSSYMLYGIIGLIFAAGILILPLRIHHVSAQSEAALLAKNINDAARSVLATPAGTDTWVDIRLPEKLGGKKYAVAFWRGRIWVGLEDRRLFNFTTVVSNSADIFYGGGTIRLEKRGNAVYAGTPP
jgi:hypothetical protein